MIEIEQPAFPSGDKIIGMSLHDWFAGQALSWLASCRDEEGVVDEQGLAAFAYRVADAMMRERAK